MIERLKSLISIALQEDNFALTQAIKEDLKNLTDISQAIQGDVTDLKDELSNLSSEITDLNLSHMHQKVLDWLSPLNFASRHADIMSRRQKGTGEWLIDSAEFQDWSSGRQRMLWCAGMPGAGKTTLTAIVVDHLQRLYASHKDTAVLFVYNNYKDHEAQSTTNMIDSLLSQVLLNQSSVSTEVMDLYQKCQRMNTRATDDELCGVLCAQLLKFTQVFVLVDALDEFNAETGNRENFISQLQKIVEQNPTRLLVTSRHNVECSFSDAKHIEIRASDADIREYLRFRVLSNSSMKFRVRLDATLQTSIIDRLAENAKGMFLSVELYLLALAKKQNKRDPLRALESLPRDLDGIYQDTMDRISTQDPDDVALAYRILSWLSYSPQPMTVEELQHALAIEPDTESFDFDMIIDESLLVSVCGGLVTIELESRVIRLVHFTAQEYIANVRQKISPNAKFEILVCCLTYLQQKTFKSDMCLRWGVHSNCDAKLFSRMPGSHLVRPYCSCTGCLADETIKSKDFSFQCECQRCRECNVFLFYNHATQNWPFYARGQLEQHSRGASAIINFLSNDVVRCNFSVKNTEVISCGMMIFKAALDNVLDTRDRTNFSRLNVAIVLGLESICGQLLEDETTADADHDGKWSALHYAVWKNDVRVMQLLLRTSADVDRSRYVRTTPLILAMKLKRLKMLRILLEDETLGTRKNPIGQRALAAATGLGDNAFSVIKLLLEHKVPVDSRESVYDETALYRVQHPSIAKLLLGHGASVTIVDLLGRTPLHSAANSGYDEVARLLLEHGAYVDATDRQLSTPLHKAAESGHINMVRLLFENGASFNAERWKHLRPASLH